MMPTYNSLFFVLFLSSTQILKCLSYTQTDIKSASLQNLNYNSELVGHVLLRLHKLSHHQCYRECISRQQCSSYNYRRLIPLCELNDADSITDPYDLDKSAENVVYSEKSTWNIQVLDASCGVCGTDEVCEISNTNTVSCNIAECLPPDVPYAEVQGNMVNIGAKFAHSCLGDYFHIGDNKTTSECLDTGEWSGSNFACVHVNCSYPPTLNNTNVTLATRSGGYSAFIEAIYECSDSFITRAAPARCYSNTGDFRQYHLDKVCCDVFDTEPWFRVLRLTENWWINDTVWDPWEIEQLMPDCQFYNKSLFNAWNTSDIGEVKVEIYENDQVEAWLIFNGTNTTKDSWFSKDNMIDSSWTDLTLTDQSEFSIAGFSYNGSYQRFAILDTSPGAPDQCHNDTTGWLMVAFNYHCGPAPAPYHVEILYATGTSLSSFESGTAGHAQKMEISVKFGTPAN